MVITYAGSDGLPAGETVSSLPWSKTVSPEPAFISLFALPTTGTDDPDITPTIKRGDTVLKECRGIADLCTL